MRSTVRFLAASSLTGAVAAIGCAAAASRSDDPGPSPGVSSGAGGGGAGLGGGAGASGVGGEPALACTIPLEPPSMGSCVPFMSDVSKELDAGLDDMGNASRTTCNPITNAGCTGNDVCGTDNSGMYYVCWPAGSPSNVAACGDCTSQSATCAAGGLCILTTSAILGPAACEQMCCTDADCGTGRCNNNLEPPLPSGVGLCFLH